jgi:hypothetical protein
LTIAEFDADGNKKATAYDAHGARGKVMQVSVPHTPTGSATVQRTTKYYFDENGNQTRVESPIGVSTTNDATDSEAADRRGAVRLMAWRGCCRWHER